jgi:hypothetical protein
MKKLAAVWPLHSSTGMQTFTVFRNPFYILNLKTKRTKLNTHKRNKNEKKTGTVNRSVGTAWNQDIAREYWQSRSNFGNLVFHIPYRPRITPKEIKNSTKSNFGGGNSFILLLDRNQC